MSRHLLAIAAVSGFLAVAFGAFGAHGLRAHLSPEMLAIYHTGVEYQFYHTLALLAVALLQRQGSQSPWLQRSGYLFAFGIAVFSGSLYVLAITGVRWLGAITPIGGVALLGGWLCLVRAGWEQRA